MSKTTSEDVTLKEIILLINKWFLFFLSKWKLILGVAAIGASIGVVLAFLSKPMYKAELTMALEEKGGGGGAYAGLASQFGLDLGGGSGGVFIGENNIELLKSRYLIEKALLTSVEIDGQKDLLVNRYIRFSGLDNKWKADSSLSGIIFTANEPREKFSVKKDSLLSTIYKDIRTNKLRVSKLDKKLSIIKVEVTSPDELFAKFFTEVLVETSSNFYIQTKTKRSRQNLDILENRLDSVKRELDGEIWGAAQSKDRNMNTIRAEGNIQSAKKQLNVQVLTAMYGELVKNTELAKYTLMREEPLIQVIDHPILPLEKIKKGKLKGLILGGFLGGFAAVFLIWIREMKKTIMA